MSEELGRAVAAVIRELMAERGWSGRKLAEQAGLVPSVVAYKINDTRPFDVGDLSAIAAAFDMRVSELVARAEGTV